MKRGVLPIIIVVSVALLAAGVFAASKLYRVPGCESPVNEKALLDEFAADPVLAVKPEGAQARERPERIVACRRAGAEASRTTVSVQYDLSQDLSRPQARALFDPVARQSGWLSAGDADWVVAYCREVLGVPSTLMLIWHEVRPIEEGRPHLGSLSVVIQAASCEGLPVSG